MRKLYLLLNVYVLLVVMAALTGWLVSCQEKEEFIPLKIFSVEPAEALIGDTIMIIGEGFSPGIRYNKVFFPGLEIPATPMNNSTQNRLWVVVPQKSATGPLTVNLFDEEVAESPVLTVKAPVIESVAPTEGLAGDTVIIRGSNFRPEKDKNAVLFNPENNAAVSAVVVSASGTELKVIVPLDSRTGKISVLGFEGPEFTIFPPSITKIEPLECIVGDTITITGLGLNIDPDRTNIRFTGSALNAFILPGHTSRTLQVIVAEDAADGPIAIRYSGNELTSEQGLMVYPSIAELSPRSGGPRTPVTINGYGFSTIESSNIVRFGGVVARDVTEISARQLRAVVPEGADTGPVTVEVNGRLSSGPAPVFEIAAEGSPLIFEIDPPSGPVGTYTYLIGDYFSEVESENIVMFTGDSLADVVEASRTLLKVKIPYGAKKGPITVTVGDKKGTGPEFTPSSTLLPRIESITPAFIEPGGTFTIKGVNLAEFTKDIVLSIQNGGGSGDPFAPVTASAELVTAKMPANQPAGEYTLQLFQYGVTDRSTVTVAKTPRIESISPAEGSPGSVVVLTGQNFHNIDSKNEVKFGDQVAVITNGSATDINKISVVVPSGLVRGAYTVTVSAYGGKVSNTDKTFLMKGIPTDVKEVYYTRRTQSAALPNPANYWIEKAYYADDAAKTDTMFIASTASSNPQVHIRSLVLDFTDEKVYFSLGAPGSGSNIFTPSNTLKWKKLNGSESGEMVLPNAGSMGKTTYVITDLSLNAGSTNVLYCARTAPPAANPTNWELLKGNVTEASTNFYVHSVLANSPNGTGLVLRGITYCPDNQLIYLCEQTSTTATRISTVDANGTAPVAPVAFNPPVSIPAGGGTVIVDMKIDWARKKMFMLCANATSFSTHTRRRIVVADLNATGTGVTAIQEFLNIEDEPNANINGIALDTEHEYVYWIKHTTEVTTERPSGVYRKRYDQAPIPGSAPDGIPANNLTVERIYNVENQSQGAVNIFGGLGIKSGTGAGASQRRRGASQRISLNLAFDLNLYEDR